MIKVRKSPKNSKISRKKNLKICRRMEGSGSSGQKGISQFFPKGLFWLYPPLHTSSLELVSLSKNNGDAKLAKMIYQLFSFN